MAYFGDGEFNPSKMEYMFVCTYLRISVPS